MESSNGPILKFESFEYLSMGKVRFIGIDAWRTGEDWGALWARAEEFMPVLDALMAYYAIDVTQRCSLIHSGGFEVGVEEHFIAGRFFKAGTPVPEGYDYYDVLTERAGYAVYSSRDFNMDIEPAYTLTRDKILGDGLLVPYPQGYWHAEVYTDGRPHEGYYRFGYMFPAVERDKYRPRLHFSPLKNWINDPNGLMFDGEKYHIFAQHCLSVDGGPQHWYHATSRDLVHFDHLPIAIYPDENGLIWSGSAVMDHKNVSGLGTADCPPLIALYTCHGEHEQQCVAFSADGVNFEKYGKNPVVANTEKPDFRDPKIFWNEKLGCWSFVVAAGKSVEFYRSENFLDWTKTGEFTDNDANLSAVFECPDIFPLIDQNGEEKWILVVSLPFEANENGTRTFYYTGDFDGDVFIKDEDITLIDSGFDLYAAISFFDAPDGVIMTGWNVNWRYCGTVPADSFRGFLSLPREIGLLEVDGRHRLTQKPINAIDAQFGRFEPLNDWAEIKTDTFKIELEAKGDFQLSFENEQGGGFSVGLSNGEVYCNRSGAMNFIHQMCVAEFFEISKTKRLQSGRFAVSLYFDVAGCELFADNGLIAMTNLVYPENPLSRIRVTGEVTAEISFFTQE